MTPEPQAGRAAASLLLIWLFRGAKVVLLLAAAAALADILSFSVRVARYGEGHRPIVRPEAERAKESLNAPWWEGDLWSQSAPPPKRTIAVLATSSQTAITFEVTLPKTERLAERVATGFFSKKDMPLLCQNIFGPVKVNERPLKDADFQMPVWRIDSTGQSMHIWITATVGAEQVSVVEIGDIRSAAPRLVCDEFKLSLNEVQLRHIYPVPDKASDTEVILGPETLKGQPAFNFTIGTFDSAERQAASAPSRQAYLMRVGGLIDFPFIGNILFGIVKVFPVLIFVVFASAWRSGAAQSTTATLIERILAVMGGLLVLHFAPHILNALGDVFWKCRMVGTQISHYLYGWFGVEGPWRIVPAVIGVLVPALLFERARFGRSNPRSPLSKIAAGIVGLILFLVVIVTIAFYAGAEMDTMGWPTRRTAGWFLMASATLLLWLTFHIAFRQVATPDGGAASLGAAFVVLGIAAVQNSWGSTDYRQRSIILAVSIVLGAALLLALTRMVSVRLFATVRPFTGGWNWLVRGGAVLLALPIGIFIATGTSSIRATLLLDFAFQLDQLLTLIFAAALLLVLHEQGKDDVKLDSFTRFSGILGASAIFFPAITRWMYIPVRFLLGLWLLALLVRPAKYWDELRAAYEKVVANRHTFLRRLIDLNTAEAAHTDFRKNLSKKVSAARVTLATYDDELRQATEQMTELRNRTTIADRPAKEFTLAFGPYGSAWENALHGTRWALLFGLPWIGFFVGDYLPASISAGTYPHWDFVTDFLNVIVAWGAIGFFFGYFYPYIRGRNGLQKGFTVFIGIVAPALPLMALFNFNAAAWRADLFWMVQIFIQCMLIGLVAFDYRIVRKSGFDWPMLFELHGFTRIGISLSSILAAIGVAITSLLSSQATTLVSDALNMFKPATAESKEPPKSGGAPTPAPSPTPSP